uniref:Uncharacterized protein n=1 Tax=Rhizophora mucronata TaxID=61149 RepID=A0A2P2QL30_RHIMU
MFDEYHAVTSPIVNRRDVLFMAAAAAASSLPPPLSVGDLSALIGKSRRLFFGGGGREREGEGIRCGEEYSNCMDLRRNRTVFC